MAQIPDYIARQGLGAGATPRVQVGNEVNQAVQGLGGAVSDVAASFIRRQEQKEEFKTDNAYRKLQLDLQNELATRAASMTEGGDGFHDSFMTETFRPRREEFLSAVPARLRPQYEERLADQSGADFTDWSVRAATAERDENYRWYKQEISTTHEQLANAITLAPDDYDAYWKSGRELIDSAPLPTPEKALLRQRWDEIAQTASLETLLENDPQAVLRELGHDARQLSPTTQFELLSRSVQWQESRDNPGAVSGKGAIGLMQVMPATAMEIAGKLKDPNFPQDKEQILEYLSNPYVNKLYGEFYLREQLRTFAGTRNPIETALVAYNAGPGTAAKWVESGYDDSLLPKETRDYKKAIRESMSAPLTKGDPASVQFVGIEGADLNVEGELKSRVADAFATVGLDKVRVRSGFRDEARNKAAGGATQSRHMHGDAMDIDVAGMPLAQRVELIKSLSAAGVTGIGVYTNTIHADLGGRRAWGPSHGAESVPKWAADVLGQHVKGTTPAPRGISSRYGNLSYDKRQAFTDRADRAIAGQATAAQRASAAEKVTVKQEMDNELATIRATGRPSGLFDEARVSTVLGEDDYLTYAYKRDIARKTFTALDGIATMPSADMTVRLEDYAPVAGAADFSAQQEIEAAVQREIIRVTNLRARSPALAAMEFPEVAEAYKAIQASFAQGNPVPADVQGFVRTMLDAQGRIDIAPAARAPVPMDWALQIGSDLARVPEVAGAKKLEVLRAAIAVQYLKQQEMFGDYTDEVLTYAVSEYKGIDRETAKHVTKWMTSIQAGGDPFRPRTVGDALDLSMMQSTLPYRNTGIPIYDGIAGGVDTVRRMFSRPPTEPVEETGLTPEEQLLRTQAEDDDE